MSIPFIDLFAGIGGIRLGFEQTGFECVFSSEMDKHAVEMYQANYGEKPFGDITQIKAKQVPEHSVVLAGFPCQAFSISGRKMGFKDTRGTLFFHVARLAQEKAPEVLVLENVKHLFHHDKGKTLTVIVNTLKEMGYFVAFEVLNSSDFGVAQVRERIVIVAAKKQTFDFSKLKTQPPVFIKDILDQKEFDVLQPEEYTLLPPELVKKQKSGLIFTGYLNKAMRSNGVKAGSENLSRAHKQPNRIYSSDGFHPTLSSGESSGRYYVFHQGVVRKLSLRECYTLMGFPDNFKILGPNTQAYRRIGNSVCVPMMKAVAEQVKKQLF